MSGLTGYPRSYGTTLPPSVATALRKLGFISDSDVGLYEKHYVSIEGPAFPRLNSYDPNHSPVAVISSMATPQAPTHPMITPLDAIPPDEMAKQHSDEGMRNVYRIVWDNTLAYMAKQPLVKEHRIFYVTDNNQLLEVGVVEVVKEGWRQFQPKEESAMPAVCSSELSLLTSQENLKIDHLVIEEAPLGVATDEAIAWLAEKRIASPGTLRDILERMEKPGWILWDDVGRITLSPSGQNLLSGLDQAGFSSLNVEAVTAFRNALDEHEEGTRTVEESAALIWSALGLQDIESLDWLNNIDNFPTHRADDAYARQARQAIKPPIVSGYPTAIDPERILPANAPERLERVEIERELASQFGERWWGLTSREKAMERLKRLAVRRREDFGDLCERSFFDVKLRWLIGLGAEQSGFTR